MSGDTLAGRNWNERAEGAGESRPYVLKPAA
jgi:hypothetical protein